MRGTRWIVWVVLVCTVGVPRSFGDEEPAWSGPVTSQALEAAKAALARGKDAFAIGHYLESIQEFEDAYRLSHRSQILYNIALANRKAYALDGKPEHLRMALDILVRFLRSDPGTAESDAARKNLTQLNGLLAVELERERMQRLRSGGGPRELQAALKLSAEGKLADALAQLDRLLLRGKQPETVLADVYRLQGELNADLGNTALATDAYERLLAIAPASEISAAGSAAVKKSFERARQFWAAGAFALSPVTPPPATPGQPLAIPVEVENDRLLLVSQLIVRYRHAGSRNYSSVARPGAGDLVIPAIDLPAEDAAYRVEYFLQAIDTNGNVLGSAGSEAVPLSFPVLTQEEAHKLAERGTPWFASWWFWTGASVVVAGAAVAIAAGAGAFSVQPPPTTSLPHSTLDFPGAVGAALGR